jgi:hypothetical protein
MNGGKDGRQDGWMAGWQEERVYEVWMARWKAIIVIT